MLRIDRAFNPVFNKPQNAKIPGNVTQDLWTVAVYKRILQGLTAVDISSTSGHEMKTGIQVQKIIKTQNVSTFTEM